MIETTQTIGEIAVNFPASTRVFGRHKIDFCCGGGIPLQEACEDRALDVAAVVSEIEQEVALGEPSELDGWASRSSEELIQHVLERYHRPLDEELPRLSILADKVARVHGSRDEALPEIARVFTELRAELESHFAKEENVLFPAILRGESDRLSTPIQVMLRDHEHAGNHIDQLRDLTRDYNVPPHACASWTALWHGLEDLERSLIEHIHLENNILFPRVTG